MSDIDFHTYQQNEHTYAYWRGQWTVGDVHVHGTRVWVHPEALRLLTGTPEQWQKYVQRWDTRNFAIDPLAPEQPGSFVGFGFELHGETVKEVLAQYEGDAEEYQEMAEGELPKGVWKSFLDAASSVGRKYKLLVNSPEEPQRIWMKFADKEFDVIDELCTAKKLCKQAKVTFDMI